MKKRLVGWSNGNVFVSGAKGLRFKSRANQNEKLPTARHRSDISRKELNSTGAMTQRQVSLTRYTFRRNAARIMKDLISIRDEKT